MPVYSCVQNRTGNMNLYENRIFSDLPEGIRPGGLPLTEHLIKLCGFNKGDMIVDIGCGSGLSLEMIRQKYCLETVGIDSSGVLLDSGIKKFPSLRLVQGNGKFLPFYDKSINGVIAECSLSVMDDPLKVLSEIGRVLSDYGRLAISDVYLRRPDTAGSFRNIVLAGCMSGAFIYDEIVSMLDASGFCLVLWEDHSDLWREFIAGLILNNGSICEIMSCGSSSGNSLKILMPEILKSKPGYFSLIAEKKS